MTRRVLIRRQSAWTRATHWTWAACLFFLLLSGLQIFNAHPVLYLGEESGFAYDNAVLRIGAREEGGALVGITEVFGQEIRTTGLLGAADGQARAFPAWATIPTGRDLATGRLVHFLFAWILVGALLVWGLASLVNGHLRGLIPTRADLRDLPRDLAEHARLRLRHGRGYGPLQKLSYAAVMFGLLPVMVLTGLSMSPAMNAVLPWLPDLFGGRQSARTVHFAAMLLLVGFFAVHVLMVLLAGPLNLLRSMLTGWMQVEEEEDGHVR
jgi:thiosulfate reductase cytochrome b subunit